MQESIPIFFDNKTRLVVDDLRNQLSSNPKVAIAAASFSIYAFEALKDELEKVDELRFIFTSPTFIREKQKKEKREFFIPKLNRERNLYGSENSATSFRRKPSPRSVLTGFAARRTSSPTFLTNWCQACSI